MSDQVGNRAGDYQQIADLDRRIEATRENIRELIEQAAANSGAADDELASKRITEQEQLLDGLMKQREELTQKGAS